MDDRLTMEKLAKMLDRCLNEGISVRFVAPKRETSYQWEEIYEIALDAYLSAIRDVREVIGGNPAAIEEFFSTDGRFMDFRSKRDRESSGKNSH